LLSPGDAQAEPAAELIGRSDGGFELLARSPGRYEVKIAAGSSRTVEVPSLPQPLELGGPWEVRFEPNRAAPERLAFDALLDWSKHPDPGVRYFSGMATYTKTFTMPAELLGKDKQLELDLGQVCVAARVRLNGRELGTLWNAPFRIRINDAAKSGDNTLEITVANLWPNRLIGDRALPEGKRVAWTTWNPFQKDSLLLESGLLGPVKLLVARRLELD
jgi:hypothetical protein